MYGFVEAPVRFALWLVAALVVSPVATLSWFFLYLNVRAIDLRRWR